MRRHRQALVINASPHRRSVVGRFFETFEKTFGKSHTFRLTLATNPPPYFDGTYNNTDTFWQRHVRNSDVLFIATPTYWYNVPSMLKSFIDDVGTIDDELRKKERFAIVAVHAPEGGEIGALNALVVPLNHMGFTLVGSGLVYYRGTREDNWAWTYLKEAARSVRYI